MDSLFPNQFFTRTIHATTSVVTKGKVLQVIGSMIKAYVPGVKIGELCTLLNPKDKTQSLAEVVGFVQDAALLTPLGDINGISSSTQVIPSGRMHSVPVGMGLLGRVLDGLGNPIDGKGPLLSLPL